MSKKDTLYAAKVFEDFYKGFGRIDDYMRSVKIERMKSYSGLYLPGYGPKSELFNLPDMHPKDMEFSVAIAPSKTIMQYLELVSSFPAEGAIPGRGLFVVVKETNTNTVVGMLRFGSPLINSRPRNLWLGKPLNTYDPAAMKRFNDSTVMGFAIVPVQPFGYNCLGGKLLAALCCSHEVINLWEQKYGGTICLFETTSLYGTTKALSQYDGMKPILRFGGLTDSNFSPPLNDNRYLELKGWFADRNSGVPIVSDQATSKKLKTQVKMLSIIKKSLKEFDVELYNQFCLTCEQSRKLTERKRTFRSTYGYENAAAYLNMETDTLVKGENYDKMSFDNLVSWWRKKAINRYEKLQNNGLLKTELEVWDTEPEKINIMRD